MRYKDIEACSKPDWTETVTHNNHKFELEFEPDTFTVSFDSQAVKAEDFVEVLEFIAAKAKNAFALDETFEFSLYSWGAENEAAYKWQTSNTEILDKIPVEPGGKTWISAWSIYCGLRDLRLDHWQAVDLLQKPWGHRFPSKHLGTFPDGDKIVSYMDEDPQEYTADDFIGEDRPLSAIVETPLGLQVFTNLRW